MHLTNTCLFHTQKLVPRKSGLDRFHMYLQSYYLLISIILVVNSADSAAFITIFMEYLKKF